MSPTPYSTYDLQKTYKSSTKNTSNTEESNSEFNRKNCRNIDFTESWDPEHRICLTEQSEDKLAMSYGFNNTIQCKAKSGTELFSKGPIEARVEKYTGIQKALFQPKKPKFSSPKIVKASPIFLSTTSLIKRALNSEPRKIDGTYTPNIKTISHRRVSAGLLLDNFLKKTQKSTIAPKSFSQNSRLAQEFTKMFTFYSPKHNSNSFQRSSSGTIIALVKKDSVKNNVSVREELLRLVSKMK